MEGYRETIEFWDDVFQVDEEFDPAEPLSAKEIDSSLRWLAEDSKNIIDFGCGNGKALLRAVHLCDGTGIGIDISSEAVKVAKEHAEMNGFEAVKFIEGGLEQLKGFSEDTFDSGILFNILDNLKPDDAEMLVKEFKRLLKDGGKLLVKLNDYVDPEQLEEWGAEELSKDFYREESGLYFWDLKDEEVKELLKPHFEIEKEVDITYEEHDQVNRLYYLEVNETN